MVTSSGHSAGPDINKVALSGLSAAGKTTHALLLAHALNFGTVHFTDVLFAELGIPNDRPGEVWLRRLREIEVLRERADADSRADDLVVERMRGESNLVVDSMLSPWLGPDDTLRIWIGSDRLSRTWKCMVSFLPDWQVGTAAGAAALDEKDGLTRSRFLRDHGIDIYADRSVFDFVLDNSHVISNPTRASSDRGIEIFHQVLLACATAGLTDDWLPLKQILATDDPVYAGAVVSIGARMDSRRHLLSKPSRAPLPSRIL